MKKSFTTSAGFKSLTLQSDPSKWTFQFVGDVYASANGFWRIFHKQKLVYVSMDQGHTFGLPKPEDLVGELNALLIGQILQSIDVHAGSGDLVLNLSGNYRIELFVTSMGFETTEFSIGGKRYIGQGGGNYLVADA